MNFNVVVSIIIILLCLYIFTYLLYVLSTKKEHFVGEMNLKNRKKKLFLKLSKLKDHIQELQNMYDEEVPGESKNPKK